MTGSAAARNDARDTRVALSIALQLPAVEAFDSFYEREFRLLVAMAFALTGSRAHAEDVAQEAMLVAYRRWDEISRLDAPHAWVRKVCANLSVSLVRRRMVEARGLLALRRHRSEITELQEDDATFWAEVRRLPRRQAQCIVLLYLYGCTVTEIAQVLGCSDGSVKTHLSRGRSKLASRLGAGADEALRIDEREPR